jgi:predicted Zn-dependent protease
MDEAEELLRSALRTERENATAWYWLGQTYGRQGREAMAEYATAEQAFSMGDYNRAKQFAVRAQEDLPRNGPSWRRAGDIVAVAEVQLTRSKREQRRGPKPFTASFERQGELQRLPR